MMKLNELRRACGGATIALVMSLPLSGCQGGEAVPDEITMGEEEVATIQRVPVEACGGEAGLRAVADTGEALAGCHGVPGHTCREHDDGKVVENAAMKGRYAMAYDATATYFSHVCGQ